MGTTLATYYAKLQDMPDSEYKVRWANQEDCSQWQGI